MIVSFPYLLMEFHIVQDLSKGSEASCAHLVAGHKIVITAPIQMKADDHFLVDIRNGRMEIIERGGIVIWRATCMN